MPSYSLFGRRRKETTSASSTSGPSPKLSASLPPSHKPQQHTYRSRDDKLPPLPPARHPPGHTTMPALNYVKEDNHNHTSELGQLSSASASRRNQQSIAGNAIQNSPPKPRLDGDQSYNSTKLLRRMSTGSVPSLNQSMANVSTEEYQVGSDIIESRVTRAENDLV